MKKRAPATCAALAALCAAAAAAATPATPSPAPAAAAAPVRPNIVVIMADDLGWNHIGVEKATLGTADKLYVTPNIRKLADAGCSFPYAHMQANCAPTRACILSGQYAPRNGIYNVGSLNRGGNPAKLMFRGQKQSEDLRPGCDTLARALKKNGYATAHIGKYHVGGRSPGTFPEKMGFDINIGGCAQGHQPVCFASRGRKKGAWRFPGLGRGDFDRFAAPYSKEYAARRGLPASLVGTPKHVCDAVGDAAVETVGKLAAAGAPFYLEVHTYAVHGPVQARPDLRAAAAKAGAKTDAARGRKGTPVRPTADFAGFIAGLDETVGRIRAALRDPDGDGDPSDSIEARTVVVFTSDNGGFSASNAPLRGIKGMHTEGGTRVPLLIAWPGRIPAGSVSARVVHAVDFYPTWLDFAAPGGRRPDPSAHPLDGFSFKDECLRPGSLPPRPPVYWFFPGYLDFRSRPLLSGVAARGGCVYRFTYRYEENDWRLWNLTKDPGETRDAAAEEPGALAALAADAVGWLRQKTPLWNPLYPIENKTGKPRRDIPLPPPPRPPRP